MSRLSIHQEDRLRPVARVGDDLWFFSALDGCLYRNAPQYLRQTLPEGGRWFLVPGDESAYRVRFDGTILCVERFEFATGTSPMSSEVSEHIIPGGTGLVPTGVVAAQRDSRSVLLQSPDGARTTAVDVKSGGMRIVSHRADVRVLRILDSGATVLAGNGRFEVTFEDRRVDGSGKIAATSGTHVLLREESRRLRVFRIACESGDDLLRPPSGWSPIQAAFATGDVVLTCLHSAHGYGLWRKSDGTVRALPGTPQLFPLGQGPPALRVTGISTGSVWLHGDDRWPGTAVARPDLPVQAVRIDGMPCLHLRARNPRALVLAFHGGPDSHEWDDLRYGGAYRTLVDRGIEVLIVNAAGSADLGLPFQSAAWKRWPKEASRSGRSLALEPAPA